MKKTLLAITTIASLGMISTAQAANEITFNGAVNALTCELAPDVNGSIAGLLYLGTAPQNGKADTVAFKFKAKDVDNCGGILAGNAVTMAWSGSALGATGLEMTSGAAAGAWVELTTAPLTAAAVSITSGTPDATFTGADLVDGLSYTATLNGGGTAGNFRTAAAYTVAYN